MIFVWHHAQGAAPSYDPPHVPEWGQPDWEPWQRFRWRVRSASQEIIEGAVDGVHFPMVHGNAGIPSMEVHFEGAFLRTRTSLHLPEGPTQMEVCFHGIGAGVGRKHGVGDVAFIGTETPIDDETVDFRFSLMREHQHDLPRDAQSTSTDARGVARTSRSGRTGFQPKPMLCDVGGDRNTAAGQPVLPE
jgi:hypothetical protein